MKRLFSNKLTKNKIAISVASLLVLGTGTAYGTYEGTKNTVNLTVDGKEQQIRTHADTVGDLLKDLKIDVRNEDRVTPKANTELTSDIDVVYDHAQSVQLTMGDERRTIWTTAKTVEQLIEEEEIDINEHDIIKPALSSKIEEGLKLDIKKAFQVKLNVAGKEKQVWATSTTVADFLKDQNIQLNDLDKVEPTLDHQLSKKDGAVTVTKVEKVTDVVEEPVAFAVKTEKASDLTKGKQEVIEPGEEGKKEKHYEVVMENGKEVSRKLLKEEIVKESKDRVVALGTKAEPQQVSTATVSRSNNSNGKEFYVSSTAYTASCNGCSGVTATGMNLRSNPNAKVIAVDPNVIPLGSKVHVEGYGYAIAADTGGAIKGNKIDVFFSDKSSAYRWGRKQVKIKVLD
ncbi:G5 and 3D domain-containing protein [Metabacillus arenae]|uniref:DUF348 domain-containing protein n=1 Tax=Metabacillus arenae TaxID=2771434 RepID=A0A926S411_9BACI|nr:G5 and 3D domain-containing protein [Metabacillus arenae]MBD1383509.1 DUF348 domain-containing protein [Metabacillus arenae]